MSVSDQKKKQIVEAAIAEFQEKGFAGASMDRISERAQVSKRTVYNHFESKETLFKAINQCLADQVNSALEVPYDRDKPIRDALIELGWAEAGDAVLLLAGKPLGVTKVTNSLAIHYVGDPGSGYLGSEVSQSEHPAR